jgi:hypothetical protein
LSPGTKPPLPRHNARLTSAVLPASYDATRLGACATE